MSSQPAEAPAPNPEPKAAPATVPPVTESYQKAHRNYVMAAALLLSWQFIGIELETKEKWGVVLKSPRAIPIILFVLVVYFGYKLVIEWHQCDSERRNNKLARVDYEVAHGIAFVTVHLCLSQGALHVQFADVIARHQHLANLALFSIVFIGFQVVMGVAALINPKLVPMWKLMYLSLTCASASILIPELAWYLSMPKYGEWVVNVIVIALRVWAIVLFVLWIKRGSAAMSAILIPRDAADAVTTQETPRHSKASQR